MIPVGRSSIFILLAVAILLVFGGCADSPTTIVVSVSLVNPDNWPQDWPPPGHGGDFSDDVCYIRLVDASVSPPTTASTIWESPAYPMTTLASITGNTSPDGINLLNIIINPDDTAIGAATLVLETFLFNDDTQPDLETSLDPAAASSCYTVNPYDTGAGVATTGKPGWSTNFNLPAGTIRIVNLSVGTVY